MMTFPRYESIFDVKLKPSKEINTFKHVYLILTNITVCHSRSNEQNEHCIFTPSRTNEGDDGDDDDDGDDNFETKRLHILLIYGWIFLCSTVYGYIRLCVHLCRLKFQEWKPKINGNGMKCIDACHSACFGV